MHPLTQLERLWPLSESYEYTAELGLTWRMEHRSDWEQFCREVDIEALPLAQARGYAFWRWLESERPEQVRALLPGLLAMAADRLQVEIQASLDCLGRDYTERPDPDPLPELGGEEVIVIEPPVLLAHGLDSWTEEALDGARVRSHASRWADEKEIVRAHQPLYVEGLRELSAAGGALLTPETAVGPESWQHCRAGAGALLSALELAISEQPSAPILCRARPGSHHAEPSRAGGTCLLNNIAVAAEEALLQRSVEYVCVLDIDAHHGNGTERIFYEEERVRTASVHQRPPFFPGTGSLRDQGRGRGKGANLNIPVEPQLDWGAAALEAIEWLERGPRSQAIFVELSTDAHRSDPVSDLQGTDADYRQIGYRLGCLKAPVIVELGASLSRRAWIGGLRSFIAGFAEARQG